MDIKGTAGRGKEVNLAAGVAHAREPAGMTALFVVHGIAGDRNEAAVPLRPAAS